MSDPFYGSAAGFIDYWTGMAQQIFIAQFDDDDIEAALLISSNYIDNAFREQFMGLKVGQRAQVREWPRIGVQDIYGYAVDSSVVPDEVNKATYEAAFRQLQNPGIFFKDYTPSQYKSVAISGAVNVTWAVGTAYDFQTQYPQIAAVLDPILTAEGSAGFSSLSGGVGRV